MASSLRKFNGCFTRLHTIDGKSYLDRIRLENDTDDKVILKCSEHTVGSTRYRNMSTAFNLNVSEEFKIEDHSVFGKCKLEDGILVCRKDNLTTTFGINKDTFFTSISIENTMAGRMYFFDKANDDMCKDM